MTLKCKFECISAEISALESYIYWYTFLYYTIDIFYIYKNGHLADMCVSLQNLAVHFHIFLRGHKYVNPYIPTHTPEEYWSDHKQTPGWQPILCVAWCLIRPFASFKKSMVLHDTDFPYWDQVSLNNTITIHPSIHFHMYQDEWGVLVPRSK